MTFVILGRVFKLYGKDALAAAGVMLGVACLAGCAAIGTPEPTYGAISESVQTDGIDRNRAVVDGSYGALIIYVGPAADPANGTCVLVSDGTDRVLEGCGTGPTFESSVPGLTIKYFSEAYEDRSQDGWYTATPHVLVRDS